VTVDQPLPQDEGVLRLLQERNGSASQVALNDGKKLTVFNIAWGYDLGDEFAHVITNISPDVEDAAVDFFSTASITAIIDPTNGAVLYQC
jgi:hypothetical protein